MRLAGKRVVITGGAAGIGRATALRAASEGARVYLVDRDVEQGEETLGAIRASGGEARFGRCDITQESEVRALAGRLRAEWEGVDVLITSAGILQGAYQPVETLELATFERVMDVNLLGTFLCCKHLAPLMGQGGVALCLSSGGGIRGPSSSLAYGASKAAVQGFCLTLQQQLAPRGIRVNVVCPGSIDTALKRQNIRDGALARGEDPDAVAAATQLGDPDGVAKVLTFLASDDAAYVTGTLFTL
ncbi:MAG: SDR family NAD(P)-dependent oxidoreductase [Actinomycetota bacterium]